MKANRASELRPRAIDWLFSAPFLLTFGLVLLVFDPLQRIARLFGQRPQEYVAGCLQVSLMWATRLSGARVQVERSPGVRPRAPYLFISNHQSMFDIPFFGALLFTNFPKYVSKRELAKGIPSISYNLRRGGNSLIDRDDRDQATQAVRKLGEQVLERGVSAVIFPEGTRAREGRLRSFRRAGLHALLDSAPDIPVVAVTIDGSWRLLRFDLLPVPFGTRIRIRIGDPIERTSDETNEQVIARVRGEIEGTLAGWRES